MLVTWSPAACKERIAASRPLPGPFIKTSICLRPCSMLRRAAVSAATPAAYGVLFRDPLNPTVPALAQESTLPLVSVNVTWVLLNVDCIYAFPTGTFRRSLRRVRVFFSAICIPSASYFFAMARRLPATVFRAPLLVRAFVRVL